MATEDGRIERVTERWIECSDCGWNLGSDHFFPHGPLDRENVVAGAECPACGQPLITVIRESALTRLAGELEARAEKLRGELNPVPRDADPVIGGGLGSFNMDDMRRAQVARFREAAKLLRDSVQPDSLTRGERE